MTSAKAIAHLVYKDIKLELREKYALSGILLYVVSTTFVIYSAFQQVDASTWVSLFWIITLFAALNAASRSFITENPNTRLYYFLLVGPHEMILSKMLFNGLLLLVLAAISNLVFGILLGFEIEGFNLWILLSALGSLGFGLSFTMISAIASKAKNAGVLMTILGLPIIIPQLMVLIRLSNLAANGGTIAEHWGDLVSLASIDIIALAVALVVFPFLWKD
ncbi:MAG: heme exporter protein CcmB [Bacteroidetes bacterium]|nr:heme exporter protein CcmB [Bacteroidota bacterium]